MLFMNKRYLRKIIMFIMLAMLFTVLAQIFLCFNTYAETGSVEEKIIEEQAQSSEVKEIEEQLQKSVKNGVDEILPGYDPQKIMSDATKGEYAFDVSGIMNRALIYIFKEVYLNIHILIKLIILVIFCAVLKNLQSSFLSRSVGEIAFYACYIVIISVVLLSFNTAINLGKDIIDSLVVFIQASIPALVTLLMSGGNIASGGIFQPILMMIINVAATIMKNVFIPLIFLSTLLSIVNNISERVQLSKLAGFIKTICGWCLGLILTIFVAFITIQGSLGAAVDGVAGKTAKFAIGAFIPVVGKYLADAADSVIGCTLLIKNAAGVSIMIGVIAICIVPLLKILALIILFKLTSVLIEPIAETRITNLINDIAGSITYVLGIVAAVVFMFLLSVTVIISTGNTAMAIR